MLVAALVRAMIARRDEIDNWVEGWEQDNECEGCQRQDCRERGCISPATG